MSRIISPHCTEWGRGKPDTEQDLWGCHWYQKICLSWRFVHQDHKWCRYISLLGFRMTRNAWLRCHTWVFPGRLWRRHGNCKIGIDRHCLWSCQDSLVFWTTFLSGFNLFEVIELDEESFAVLPFHVVVPRFLYAQGFITVRTLSWSCLFEVLELDVRCFAMLPFQVAVPRWCKRIENKSLQYKMYVWDLVA